MKKIVLIVGASGVGKDTLIKSVKNSLHVNFTRRHITRYPDENEDNFYISHSEFETLEKMNFFISSWSAHGNKYAIAKDQIQEDINIISISRSAIQDFEKYFNDVTTIEITLEKDILYQRLKSRGRENEEEIQKRLSRNYDKIEATKLIQFDNSKNIKQSSQNFVKLIDNIINDKGIV